MTGTYRYTERDLLQGEAYHYHYTPYEGAQLLPSYLQDRQQALDDLAANREEGAKELAVLGGAPAPLADLPGCADAFRRRVVTLDELAAAAGWVSRGGDPSAPSVRDFVDALLRKFEVSKRLRSHYATGLALERRDSAAPEAYCYLAFLIARRDTSDDRLWRLNAVLKLNDLILSTDTDRLAPAATLALVAALERELRMVRSLAQSKGVLPQ